MSKRILEKEIREAYQKIEGEILKTPIEFSPELSRISGARVFLKMEHLQYTGSFKIRGVCNKINTIPVSGLQKEFVAASTGNHAAAFTYAAEKFGFRGVLFLPENVNEVKRKVLKSGKIKIHLHGKNSVETESYASRYAKESDGVLIHPYNDRDVIIGQGTIGLEIMEQWPRVNTILAPIGGGGLISGLSSYFHGKEVDIISCQPKNACEMYDSIQKGSIVEPSKKATIADATAGGIEADSLTFEICKNELEQFELIAEDEIKNAVTFMVEHHQTIIEPGAALPVSAMFRSKKYQGKNVVLVITGKKINPDLLTEILVGNGTNN